MARIIGASTGDFGSMNVDALFMPATPMLRTLRSAVMDSIKAKVGNGLSDICQKTFAHFPREEKCPIGHALLTRFTEPLVEHRCNPPMATKYCIHFTTPD